MIFGNPVKSKSASTPQISEMPKIAAAVSTTNHFTPDQSGPCMPTVGHGKLASSGKDHAEPYGFGIAPWS